MYRNHKVRALLLTAIEVLMILLCAAWVSLWLLKPTDLWTRKWRLAENSARATVFGYYGLNFVVYTFPVIALVIIGLVYLNFKPSKPRTFRRSKFSTFSNALSNPLVVNSYLGVLSGTEILGVAFFLLFLVWTFYARISKDFRKLMPAESLNLQIWELKYLRVATRFGLLAEACLGLLLLPILRGLAPFRLIGIQFEASVKYHIWLGTAMVLFATFHGASTLFIWGLSNQIQDQMWKWQNTGRIYIAGEITLITGLVIWITSLPQIRRRKFEIFYYTHHLYIVFFVFFLFHAGDRHFYMVFPGLFLFGIDKVLRIIQSRTETCVVSAQILPCKAVELTLPKDQRLKYKPTSVVYVKIPRISRFQWHAFSLISSSSVNDDTMSIVVKCDKSWTRSLYDMISAEREGESNQLKCISIAVEGPYGPASMDFLRYDHLLLIAGGIGVTPLLSILQEITSMQKSSNFKCPARIQLIHVMKKSHDVSLLTSILPLLLNHLDAKMYLQLKVFVTQEEESSTTVSELLNKFSQVQTIQSSTKCSSHAAQGLESLGGMATITGLTSIMFFVALVFFNHIVIPTEKASKKTKDRTPSWISDLLLMSSFALAILCGAVVGIILRWRRLKKETVAVIQSQNQNAVPSSEARASIQEEHEIQFGGRPNFKDIFSDIQNDAGGSEIGVISCGPETMNMSVASACKEMCECLRRGSKKKKQKFNFHSLNFTL
ncbi:ferric reduction oxidase 8, mitochondrial [Momordica charantia]|uniref:Ferric reduction oxidase 8, mitochondrial n=1 Tax=Momordica charantia TaxID=3673 RepID=A0A6J1C416_MOMCH|nr:ferric reduction oxidase 8, mitochondrial [Momordica charantia]